MPAIRTILGTIAASTAVYLTFIALLTVPTLQDHVIYLHRVTLTWFQDVNVPEQWGFLRNQVTPFHLQTPDNQTLHAWHVLPLDVYAEHQDQLRAESSGLCSDITQRLGFRLLKEDPEARLVLYFHGAAGTLGSGWRPQSYRALSAAAPRVHILAIDYRGFGSSTGWPSESGLLTDALTLAKLAIETAGIPPSRIVVFAQSLGTAVAISLAHHLAVGSQLLHSDVDNGDGVADKTPTALNTPAFFKGLVLVAPFADVKLLTATYRVAGTIPLLSPMASIPGALVYLNKFILSKWPSKEKLAELIRLCEEEKTEPALDRQLKKTIGSADIESETTGSVTQYHHYDVTLIHAEDDYDIPWVHSDVVFWHAANAIEEAGNTVEQKGTMTFVELEEEKKVRRKNLGAGGWEVVWQGKNGVVREQVVKHGLHDRIMSYPVVSLAIARAFGY